MLKTTGQLEPTPQGTPVGREGLTAYRELLERELSEARAQGLYRRLRLVDGEQGPRAKVDGVDCLILCSNNYLGLACHPRLKTAAAEAAHHYGTGAAASRLVSGTMRLHQLLEERLAAWCGCESALLFGSGYLANLGVISALVGRGDAVVADRLVHASILDGCRLSDAELIRYPHGDTKALERALSKTGARQRRLVVTESVFSMDGDLAPLEEIAEIAERNGALLMVDEAHAVGAFGDRGSGLIEERGLSGRGIIRIGTLGKALSSVGGFFAGDDIVREYLINRSRAFIFATALPPPALAAALAAVEMVQEAPELRARLHENAAYLREKLIELGFDLMSSSTQIIPLRVGEAQLAAELSRSLWEERVFVAPIRPPAVPSGASRLRISVSAAHSREDLDFALEALARAGRRFGLLN